MAGEQSLVAGHDVLAGIQRGFDNRPRDTLLAADEFDHDVGVGLGQINSVGRPGEPGHVAGANLVPVACRHGDNFDFASRALRKFAAVQVECLDNVTADRAQTGDRYAQRWGHFADSRTAGSLVRMDRNFLMFRAA